ncbi:hypothetical protein CRUP_037924 [Coryphaenoides rupestris]|nr:hypothetical protein CRUP_037924 [Coryphaenoides rupestris]
MSDDDEVWPLASRCSLSSCPITHTPVQHLHHPHIYSATRSTQCLLRISPLLRPLCPFQSAAVGSIFASPPPAAWTGLSHLQLWQQEDGGAAPRAPRVTTPATPTTAAAAAIAAGSSSIIATKPLISVTAQSSTESTQDAYLEGRAARGGGSGGGGAGGAAGGSGGLWTTDSLGRAIYNSTDSLDSGKAAVLAMEAAAGGVESVTDSEFESKGLPQFHSIGIQVEDSKRHGRFKRSNSVTAAVQADMELEGFPSMEDKALQFGGVGAGAGGFGRHSEPSTPTQYGAVRTVRTQGLFSYREDYRPSSSGPPSPQPDVWLSEPSLEGAEDGAGGRASPRPRDGGWFMQLLHSESKRMEGWCKEMEREAEEHDLSEESECPKVPS